MSAFQNFMSELFAKHLNDLSVNELVAVLKTSGHLPKVAEALRVIENEALQIPLELA